MKIVADDKIPYLQGVLEPYAEVVYKPGKAISNRDVKDADALIIRTRTKCDANLLEGSSVKFIATATIGFDHIDQNYCRENNIYWTNAPGCNSSSVQQYIASVLAKLFRTEETLPGQSTLGIIGVGNVGSKVEKLGRTLGMKVMLNDPPREREEGGDQWSSLEEVIEKADIISLHVPLNTEGANKTHHLADRNFLDKIKPNTILINTSRGEVVDNAALKQALKEKTLKTAVLDVWENEPNIDQELMELLALATPHIAGYSRDGKANGTAQSIRTLSRFFGLGLDDWYPGNIEKPENPVIRIKPYGKPAQEIVLEAIEATYDVSADDSRLRENPETFEKQRGDYPVRREFHAYQLAVNENYPESSVKQLEKLGFQTIKSDRKIVKE
jgi:erythronate-4-phosphate dehydrogenase